MSARYLQWLSGKESACSAGADGFDPWVWKIFWRRAWPPTPVFLPGQSHGSRSLVAYSPWGRKSRTRPSNLACTHLLANGAVINLTFRWFCWSIANSYSFATPMDCGPPGSSVHGISQQGCWSGVPFPPSEGLPDQGILLSSGWEPFLTALVPCAGLQLCVGGPPVFLRFSLLVLRTAVWEIYSTVPEPFINLSGT